MPIEFRCPGCSKLLRTPDESAGKKAKCPQCGGIADVPLTSSGPGAGFAPATSFGEPLAPLPPAMPPDKPSASPFGTTSSTNPYASPAPDFSSPTVQFSRGNLVPTRISFDKIFESVWGVFKPQWGPMALFGLVIVGANIGLQIIGQGGGAAAQATREPAIFIGFTAINTLFGMFVQTWLNIGSAIYMLKVARNERATLNDLGGAGPFLVRAILMQLLIGLVAFGIVAVFLAPAGILYLVTREQTVGLVAAIIGGVAAVVPLIYFMYRWFLALFFIVDCNLGVMDALSQSTKFMVGNKLIAFLIFLVVAMAGGVFALVTCCFGYVLVIPYMSLTLAAVFLTATGQPWGPALASPKT